MKTDRELAQIVWDYMHIGHTPETSDLILCLGSHDHSVVERVVELYHQGLAPKVIFSGGFGRNTKSTFLKPEADTFAELAYTYGVPRSDIIIENRSTNTGENILFSYRLLQKTGLSIRRIILVQKPYMERRTLATFAAQWPRPHPTFYITSLSISFTAYCTKFPEQTVINLMVGDLQRIQEYPAFGFQTKQAIPSEVWKAYTTLVGRGYTEHLLK